jgi:hypothetical protein
MSDTTYLSSGEETATVELISPTKAAEYLELNTSNRRYREGYANDLAKQWQNGHFLAGVGSIAFNKEGKLIDGQHRLNAVVKSGLTLKFVVVRSLHDNAFAAIDSGVKRTGGDVLSIFDKDIKNSNNVAALCTGILSWRKCGPTNSEPLNSMSRDTDNQDKINFYNGNKEAIQKSIARGSRMTKLGSPSVKTWSCFVFRLIESGADLETIDEFLSYVAKYQVSPQSPSTALLAKKLTEDLGRRPRLYGSNNGLALMIKAWNAFINKEDMKVLRWVRNESFPIISIPST